MSEAVKFEKIECSEIVVKHPGSDHSVTIVGHEDAAYVFVMGTRGQVTVASRNDQGVYVCVYGKNKGGPGIAVGVDENGGPLIQIYDPATRRYSAIEHAELVKLVEQKPR